MLLFLDFVPNLFTTPVGSASFLVSLVILMLLATWFLRGLYDKVDSIDDIKTEIKDLTEDVVFIRGYIQAKSNRNNDFTETNSPIRLSKIGANVSDIIKAKEAIDKIWKKVEALINSKIAELNDRNPYTIQEICFEIGANYSKHLEGASMEIVKNYAFNEGMNLSDFDILFGLEIRDRYFSEQGVKVEDVDIHDPSKLDTNKK